MHVRERVPVTVHLSPLAEGDAKEVRIPIPVYLTPTAVEALEKLADELNRRSKKKIHNRGTVIRDFLSQCGIKG